MHYRVLKYLSIATNWIGSFDFVSGAMRSRFKRLVENKKNIKVIVACHGNICRSPYAEILLKSRGGSNVSVLGSYGLDTKEGSPAQDDAISVAKERGIDLSNHSAKLLDSVKISEADVIFIFDLKNYFDFKSRFPESMEKLVFLGLFSAKESKRLLIFDPYGKSKEYFREVYSQIDSAINGLLDYLACD